MVHKRNQHPGRKASGFSILEMMIVLTVAGVLSAIAIPQMIAARRLTRSVAVTREIGTQLRLARQLAMSTRKAYTFVYDDVAKDLRVIGPIDTGTLPLNDPAYPNNPATPTNPLGSRVQAVSALDQQGLYGADVIYGKPILVPAVPPGPLVDGVNVTALVNNKLCITFQPDGSVINRVTGNPESRAMFFYNNRAAQDTASAISVLGASGRIKVWRYNSNGNIYAE
jgi:prepilin-type N-terminal cleavage/methylation domain-containing protein